MSPDDLPQRRARIDDRPLDLAWADDLEEFLRRQLAGAPAAEDVQDAATAVLIAGYLRDRGLLGTVTGLPLDTVRDLWHRSVVLTTVAFRMRPSSGDDQSLANSRRGLDAMELGLAAGAVDAVEDLAILVEDASDATYLAEGSVVCTPEEQGLAYTTRDLVLRRPDPARWLARIEWRTGEQALHTAFLLALARGAATEAAWLFRATHQEYLQAVLAKPVRDRLEDCADVASLAALALARHVGMPLAALADPWLPLDVTSSRGRPAMPLTEGVHP